MSRAAPLPSINIRLETVIKISEVNICPSLERSDALTNLLGNVPCSCLCSIAPMAVRQSTVEQQSLSGLRNQKGQCCFPLPTDGEPSA